MTHDALLALLDRDVEQHRLRALDVALARFFAECDPLAPGTLLWLAALLSRQLADGHLCLDLDALDALATEQDWPAAWRQLAGKACQAEIAIGTSALVANSRGEPGPAPLVLDGTRLYLRRYWNHECEVAEAIRARLARPPTLSDDLAAELDRWFPATGAPASPDWAKIACALAARGAFTVITGGPGTGKTTTVVRLLGVLQTLQSRAHSRPLRMRLAAPTGKAAARLNDSIAMQLAQLDMDAPTRAAIPTEVTTLHRLLGARPDTRRFAHHRGNPLHLDVLVIDEASMVDLEMMAAVLDALPATARLVLLGDKDQLSSVEAGAVLGDLCRRAEAGHYSAATVAWLEATTGDDLRAFGDADARALDQQLAMLRHSHRFSHASGIGQLARAVNGGHVAAALALLAAPPSDLAWIPSATGMQLSTLATEGRIEPPEHVAGAAVAGYRRYLERIHARPAAHADEGVHDHWAREVIDAFDGFQLLCALRRGPLGVDGLNRLIAAALQAGGLIATSEGWYEGRPVMVTRNDHALGLANGDVGICLRMPDGKGGERLSVAFQASAAAGLRVRHVLPSRLGDVQTVYAMTVHKAQGSEFDHTALVLPAESGAVLTRELLYTAITRARRRFSLVGSEAIIAATIERRTRRHSGLAGRLAD